MITLGIDLASQPKDTAACRIDWSGPHPRVHELEANCHDALVASITAHLAATGRTIHPDVSDHRIAFQEGWIHLPSI
ncbi:hypothetical protein [Haloferula sp. A504]|uniref:hypothetical protein n=1 Tax=Haloferula sp. A504 TaxID=3373601 RepID=UPI0031CBFF37|nr:hypothetical protein [Verrucomicrobiaceae bacterium E54]